jgi:hypothetical protein
MYLDVLGETSRSTNPSFGQKNAKKTLEKRWEFGEMLDGERG